jgi:N6-adenosine-specific RNA methylase IME4
MSETKPFPNKKYKVIYADPPWSYRDKARAGKRGVDYKYPTMSIIDIMELPVIDIADDDCILFMWVTFPHLETCFKVMRAWGFEYKTLGFDWVKLNKVKPTPFWGMGNWTRSNPELCLIATRGRPKRASAGVHSVMLSPIEKHSKKPLDAADRIVKLMGDVPRIELFARDKKPGWDCWGNEV